MNRLPSADQFAKLGTNQAAVLEWHLRQIQDEIVGLKDGYIWTTNGLTKARALRNARRRLKRLEKLAPSSAIDRRPHDHLT
ncbi:MAG: hypothetical protein K5872_15985 [Rhizobiaceae bacterium]|nr:hypothetical protein [Rhizobiaceae bacterium]MCV0407723.1 hypothetical protein [Rhizobiaceae bacterium]